MKFTFYLKNAAVNNSWEAHRRESTRMACIALAMERSGHQVSIADVSPQYVACPNWQFFKHLSTGDNGGWKVYPAEMLRRGQSGVDVAFRCSVGTRFDQSYIGQCRLLVAHEYAKEVEHEAKLLPINFAIHNNLIETLMEEGLFDAYINNDLQPIREFFRNGAESHSEIVGFYGQNWPARIAFVENKPDWVYADFYDHSPQKPAMESEAHARWLCGFSAGLALRGDSPKTNLPPLLAMLGIPIVMQPITVFDTPAFDDTNTVLMQLDEDGRPDWDIVLDAFADENSLVIHAKTAKATQDYISGWSPAGHARLIAERAESWT